MKTRVIEVLKGATSRLAMSVLLFSMIIREILEMIIPLVLVIGGLLLWQNTEAWYWKVLSVLMMTNVISVLDSIFGIIMSLTIGIVFIINPDEF